MQRIDVLVQAEKAKSMDNYRNMLQNCMNDYNDTGWTNSWENLEKKEQIIVN